MAIAPHWHTLAQIFAERMLNSMAEGIAIALFGWILLRALGRQNSSTRFAVWFSALAVIAALPFFGSMTAGAVSSPTLATHSAIRLPAACSVDLFLLWALIAGAGLARIAFGFWQLRKLRQSCAAIEPGSLHPLLRESLHKFGLRKFGLNKFGLKKFGSVRQLQVCTSDRVRVPTAIGFLHPAIVIPAWVLRELSPVELNAVLLHELAHLRRRDDWTNLAQRIVRALLFFHPAVWWIGHSLSLEREMACDDFVLASNPNPRAYAQCLVSVAEKSFLRRSFSLAQAAVGRMRQTTQRGARILDANRPGATRVWKPALALIAAFSAVCLISLPRAPRLVAFEERSPHVSASALKLPPVLAAESAGAPARMIPATFHIPASGTVLARNTLVRTSKTQHRSHADFTQPAAIPAKATQPEQVSAHVVLTSSEISSEDAIGTSSVLLLMQTEQVDASGQMIWSVAVWRLTVFHPVDRQLQKGITPKST